MTLKKKKSSTQRPSSKFYYLAIQEDPKSPIMDIKMFIKGGSINVYNKKYEVDLDKLKMQWQFAIITYGTDVDNNDYHDIQFVTTRQPISRQEIDFGKLIENIVNKTTDTNVRSETFARSYILSPRNKEMNMVSLLRLRKEQLQLEDWELDSLDDLHNEEPLILEFSAEHS